MSFTEWIHGDYVHGRRVRVLCDNLSELIPSDSTVLDVGCGDGLLANLILQKRPDLNLSGLDVLVREHTEIPVYLFDGTTIPLADKSKDVVMFVDVLHHTVDPMILLREAVRVARNTVVIKDHNLDGFLAGPTLKLMDRIGNARYGVALPNNYWSKQRWFDAFSTLGLTVAYWQKELGLYPKPANWFFGRSLHFVARLNLEPDS